MATLERAREAKALLRDELAGLDGVAGVGLSRASGPTEDWVLRVNVASEDVDVPPSVEGVAVEVRVVGTITPSAPGG